MSLLPDEYPPEEEQVKKVPDTPPGTILEMSYGEAKDDPRCPPSLLANCEKNNTPEDAVLRFKSV